MEEALASDAGALREEFARALEDGDANLAELLALDAVAEGLPVADGAAGDPRLRARVARILVGGIGVPRGLREDARVRDAPDARAALEIIEALADPV